MKRVPDRRGYFGSYGGRFLPETLMGPVMELEEAFRSAWRDPSFRRELRDLLRCVAGRPTPLTLAPRLTERCGGAKIYLKREDLLHTGAHKINNTLGQMLLARRMGKARVIAETGAGQHGVATAAAAAHFGIECAVYMGEEDMRRQALNVYRMRLLGADVIPVASGSRTLKDAINEALRDWVANVRTTHYVLGSVTGPHPYPTMIREFQRVIGREARLQILKAEGRLPDRLVACVGGGSNAIGFFYEFLRFPEVGMTGVEAGGRGPDSGEHAAAFFGGRPGSLHGTMSYLLQDGDGQIETTHSVSAGLDYPGVGPEHSYLREIGRVEYVTVTDEEAVSAFETLSRQEGILPALESAHAVAQVLKVAPGLSKEKSCVVCLSGRGDKDLDLVRAFRGV